MTNIYLIIENTSERDDLVQTIQSNSQMHLLDTLETAEENITVIVNAPLTQLARFLLNDWTLANRIRQIILIGGSDKYGDVTPVAEKNIYADPQSAQQVFISRIPIVMFGLNVTRNLARRSWLGYDYLVHPDHYETEECGVYVETKGPLTRGMTVCDLYSDKQFDDHDVLMVKKIKD